MKKMINVTVSIDIDTDKSIDEIKKELERGIYRGLDSAPNYIAQPKDVKITYMEN